MRAIKLVAFVDTTYIETIGKQLLAVLLADCSTKAHTVLVVLLLMVFCTTYTIAGDDIAEESIYPSHIRKANLK